MTTTLSDFVAALGALAVAGVRRRYDGPPASLSDADLPAQWVQLPQNAEAAMTFQTGGGWPELRAQLVIAYQAVAQGAQAANWVGTLSMLDSTLAALRDTAPGAVSKTTLRWTARPGIVTVAKMDYWAVLVDVIGNG